MAEKGKVSPILGFDIAIAICVKAKMKITVKLLTYKSFLTSLYKNMNI